MLRLHITSRSKFQGHRPWCQSKTHNLRLLISH